MSDMKGMLLELRDRMIRIETKLEDLPEIKLEVKKQGNKILKAETSVKTLKWIVGFMMLTAPAAVAAYVKIFRP